MKFSILQWFLCFPRSGVWKAVAEFLWNPKRMDSSMVVTVTSSYTHILKGRSSTHGMCGQFCTDLQYVDTISCSLCVLLRRVESHINAGLFNMSWTCSMISRPFGNGAQPLYLYLFIYLFLPCISQARSLCYKRWTDCICISDCSARPVIEWSGCAG